MLFFGNDSSTVLLEGDDPAEDTIAREQTLKALLSRNTHDGIAIMTLPGIPEEESLDEKRNLQVNGHHPASPREKTSRNP